MTTEQELAKSLQGKNVQFNHNPPGPDYYTVVGHDGDGMIELDELPGHFAPHLFFVVDEDKS